MRGLALLILVVAAVGGCNSAARAVDAAVDTPVDTPAAACASCRADQICVARYDGTCGGVPVCVTRVVACPNNACNPDCENAYCKPGPYQCANRPPCGNEPPGAFTCYGP